jgi:surface carbohydrate biosynthesis protein
MIGKLSAIRYCVTFSAPGKNRIVILHEADFWIRKMVLKELPATTLPVNGEKSSKFVITPGLIARSLWRMRFINWPVVIKGRSVGDFFSQLYKQYLLASLDQIGAKVVLTFIDNSGLFQTLSRLDKKRVYFAIQNGTRTLACVRDYLPKPPHPYAHISMTNLFCFGDRDVQLYRKHCHTIDSCIPVGSLVGGYYKSVISTGKKERKYDLCYVSQWHCHFYEEIVGDDYSAIMSRRVGAAISGLNSLLSLLLTDTDLTMLICPRNDDDDAEREFYKSLFGERAIIFKSDRNDFSTYRAAEQCELTVALNSTILSEIFACGQKVLWCNVPNDEHYRMPEAGISYFDGADYHVFKERVITLLETPQAEYECMTSEQARYINNYDPVNPPHEIIRAAIGNALSNS